MIGRRRINDTVEVEVNLLLGPCSCRGWDDGCRSQEQKSVFTLYFFIFDEYHRVTGDMRLARAGDQYLFRRRQSGSQAESGSGSGSSDPSRNRYRCR